MGKLFWTILGVLIGAGFVIYGAYALLLYWLMNCLSPNARC